MLFLRVRCLCPAWNWLGIGLGLAWGSQDEVGGSQGRPAEIVSAACAWLDGPRIGSMLMSDMNQLLTKKASKAKGAPGVRAVAFEVPAS